MPRHLDPGSIILGGVRSIESVAPAVSRWTGEGDHQDELAAELEDIHRATRRGYFTPDEDERLRLRFSRYLTARAALLATIREMEPFALAGRDDSEIDEPMRYRAFLIGYTAACLLVRAGRFVVRVGREDRIVQRKLDEPEPRFGIPGGRFTAIHRSLTSPVNAWRLREAMRFADAHRHALEAIEADPSFAEVGRRRVEAEEAIRVNPRRYLMARLRYRWHSFKRRNLSAFQQAMFAILEVGGRVAADIRVPGRAKRLTQEVCEGLGRIIEPGDVLITRHDDALSNLFLPGYWIHASLHIGTPAQREALGVEVDAARASRWVEPIRVLEARKDGVRFRVLEDTLAVDACAVIRPRLERGDLVRAISRAVTHEGKLYDFEFNFDRADRLACTALVYRAYHGIGGLRFRLRSRAGRHTLAAEDLLDLTLLGRGFEPVAVFGPACCGNRIVTGDDARAALVESYRPGRRGGRTGSTASSERP